MTDSQIDALIEIFQARMQKVVDEYLKRIGQQVREIGEIIPSDQTRLVQLKKLDANIAYIQREIAYAADASIEDVARIFEAIAQENARFAEAYFGEGVSTETLMQSVRAQLEVTAGEMANLSRTTVESRVYRDVIDRGIQAAQAGLESYKSGIVSIKAHCRNSSDFIITTVICLSSRVCIQIVSEAIYEVYNVRSVTSFYEEGCYININICSFSCCEDNVRVPCITSEKRNLKSLCICLLNNKGCSLDRNW